jgi:2-iminobutanoate/2-iminopropanoate deaminase
MRRSIDIDGLDFRGYPLPAAARIGNLVMSSGIAGQDVTTGEISTDLGTQVAHLFKNIDLIVSAAGGSTDDIIKCTFHVRDQPVREYINREWVRMFADPASRPARHTMNGTLTGTVEVQCEFVAVLNSTSVDK